LCKSCRTCFKFYCMFYFTCDRSVTAGEGHEASRLSAPTSRGQRRGIHREDNTATESVHRPDPTSDHVPDRRRRAPADLRGNQSRRRRPPPIPQSTYKGAITSKIKHAKNIKQVLQDLHNCCIPHYHFILACSQCRRTVQDWTVRRH